MGTVHSSRVADRCVLQGPPGAGKSTVGRLVADALGWTFVDSDAEVERQTGRSIREIFARDGEAWFRSRERAVLEAALRRDKVVVAAGGGAILDSVLRRSVLRASVLVTLRAPAEVLRARLADDGSRPLLGARGEGLEALLQGRKAAYAECTRTVDVVGSVQAAVADVIAALRGPRTVVVPLGERTYPVIFAPIQHAASLLGASPAVLVTDANVQRQWGDHAIREFGRAPPRVVLRPGEASKNLRSVERVWAAAGRSGADRNAVIASLGGGVVSDVAGFAAATWLRGVRYASIPTSLLAMADAAVGGKTGIDLPRGKNLVGAVHQPSLVCIHPAVLGTLPRRHLTAGLAEIVKIAAVFDPDFFAWLETNASSIAAWSAGTTAGDAAMIEDMIARAVQAKADVVARDELENGDRALLNFGHTVGHALEVGAGFRALHGDCVAAGMRAELALGEAIGLTSTELRRRVTSLMDAIGVSRAVHAYRATARRALRYDKKGRPGAMRVVILTDLGAAVLREVPRAHVVEVLDAVLEIR